MPFRAVILAVICQLHTEEIWVERWPAVWSGYYSLFLGFRRTGGLLSVKVGTTPVPVELTTGLDHSEEEGDVVLSASTSLV